MFDSEKLLFTLIFNDYRFFCFVVMGLFSVIWKSRDCRNEERKKWSIECELSAIRGHAEH